MSKSRPKFSSSHVFDERDFPLSVRRIERHGAGSLHSHEFHELVVLLGGAGTHLTDHGNYRIETGDVFLIRGDMAHGYADVEQMTLANILFRPRSLALPLQHLSDLPGYHALFRIEPRLRKAGRFRQRLRLSEEQLGVAARHIASLEEELDTRERGYRFTACARLMELLSYLSRCYGNSRHPEQRSLMSLGGVLSYMDQHLGEEITVGQLAWQAGMSESTLTRRFRKVLGCSPVEYIIRLRVERARRLLRDPDLNITEVAFRCGFTDSNYFSRRFRAAVGISPREYRNSRTV